MSIKEGLKWFFKEMFKGNGDISSKIVMGVILLINAIAYSYIKEDVTILNSFLLTGGGLLGASVLKEVTKKREG